MYRKMRSVQKAQDEHRPGPLRSPLPKSSPVGVGEGRTPRRPVKAAGGLIAECSLLRVYRLEGMNGPSGIVGGCAIIDIHGSRRQAKARLREEAKEAESTAAGAGAAEGVEAEPRQWRMFSSLDESHTEGTDLFCWVLGGDCLSWVFGSAHRRIERAFRSVVTTLSTIPEGRCVVPPTAPQQPPGGTAVPSIRTPPPGEKQLIYAYFVISVCHSS